MLGSLLVCFMPSCLAFFVCLHPCLLVHACVISYGFVPIFCTQDPESLLGTLFYGTHVSSVLQYDGTMDTKYKPTFFLLGHLFLLFCLITCLFTPFSAFFPCLALCVLSLFLCFLFCLYAGLVFLLRLHVHTWSKDATSKMQAENGQNASKKTQAQRRQCSVV